MATQWHVIGQKQGKNVGVIWSFDLDTRLLQVSFAILSVTRVEKDVKQAICEVFGLPEYSLVAEFVLPQCFSAMKFVTTGLANVDKILAGQQVSHFIFSSAF